MSVPSNGRSAPLLAMDPENTVAFVVVLTVVTVIAWITADELNTS